ncbi:Ig-like domain-containing protein [Brevibacillus sp. VP]|uniref:Ig-like domain-containing protein n=1 Tax=unclassified Brevibacillus TaxID=2684853 RepID=UPI000E2F2333|nr:Ig-like domain-containing protein [Brevibacillus sp. VP]RFB35934.1 DUF11 domain-containing protein [Brevibacillus sp. VP]
MNISSHDCDHHHPDNKVIVKLSANTSTITIGSIITFTVRILNKKRKGVLTNAFLFNQAPTGTVFIPNSVTVNGFPQPGASPIAGISLGTIPVRVNFVSVTYQFQVVSVPSPAEIISQARLTGTLTFPKDRQVPISVLSNVVTIPFPGACIPLQATNNGIIVCKGEGIKSFIKIANPNRNTLLFKLLSSPKHGCIKLLVDGRYAYKPNRGFTGKDIFTVLVVDPICHFTAIVRVVVLVRKNCHHHHKSSSSSSFSSSSSSSSSSCSHSHSHSYEPSSSCSSHSHSYEPSSSCSSHSHSYEPSSSCSSHSHSYKPSSSCSSHSSHSSSCFESSSSTTCTEE